MSWIPIGRKLSVWETTRLFWHLPTLLHLVGRLFADRRVALASKLGFAGALVFIVSPMDVPNFVPVLGQMSDVMLAILACRWFLGACPAHVLAQHVDDLDAHHVPLIRNP